MGDADRKRLWGRSGSRCAICNGELTELDGLDTIVGDEAHIRSPKPGGPRHDRTYAIADLNQYSNLILLCKQHHKLVDDNCDVFTVDLLEKLKTQHEARVRRSLSPDDGPWVELPALQRVDNGSELTEIMVSAHAYFMSSDQPADEDEASLIGGLLQDAQDWGEIGDEVGPAGRIQAAMSLDSQIKGLLERGLVVLGGLGRYRLTRDVVAPTAVIRVIRPGQGAD